MNNFEVIINAIDKLSDNDKNRLGEIILSSQDEFKKDPIKVLIDSVEKINTEFTDERRKEFMSNYENADSINQEVLMKGLCALFSNTDYIEWLTNYTIKNDYIDNRPADYKIYEVSKKDEEYLDNLRNFFKGIEIYANENQIKSFNLDSSFWYYVKYKDTILKITSSGFGKLHSCTISDIDSNVYIDFNELMRYYLFIKNNDGIQRKK
ncbi:MAG: hypothetical protein IKX00_04830 [Bacilli bacterium]|nr:hypothetical protein [Bacilli bacterium]